MLMKYIMNCCAKTEKLREVSVFLWSAMVASTVELVFSALLSRMSLMSLSLFRYRRSHHARLRLWRGAHLAVP